MDKKIIEARYQECPKCGENKNQNPRQQHLIRYSHDSEFEEALLINCCTCGCLIETLKPLDAQPKKYVDLDIHDLAFGVPDQPPSPELL